MGTITADDLERSYSNGLKKGREEVDALSLQVAALKAENANLARVFDSHNVTFAQLRDQITSTNRLNDELRKALRGILQYGTRAVDEDEKPMGVQIEDVLVPSTRLERDWLVAIEVAGEKRVEPSPTIEEVCPLCWKKPCQCDPHGEEKLKCECIAGVRKFCPEHGYPALRPLEGPGSVDE